MPHAEGNAKGKLNDKSRSRVSDMLISLLATPFNLLFMG